MKEDSPHPFRETSQKFHIILPTSHWPKLSHMDNPGTEKDGKCSFLASQQYIQLSIRVLSAEGEGEKR